VKASPRLFNPMTASPNPKSGVIQISSADVPAVMDQARKSMAKIYVLPNVPITGRAAFFDAVRGILPLNPPVIGSRVWDALSDSLAAGLARLDTAYVVIIWSNSRAMKAASPDEYERALLLWRDVAAELKDPSKNIRPKDVAVYLAN
jgi:Barstar (barnase inhibitor)